MFAQDENISINMFLFIKYLYIQATYTFHLQKRF